MNSPEISIIIPIYNADKYLRQCLDSVVNQTFKDIEIICIDDGSSDNSLQILKEYRQKDERIILVDLKQNKGISNARNEGIKFARGNYITFVDSDDYIEPDYIEYLYSILKTFNCKMSVCIHNVIKKGKKKKVFDIKADYKLSSQECIKRLLYNDGIDTSAWAKLYDKTLFDNIKYPEGKLFEDIAITYKLFIKSKEIACGHLAKYNYVIRENSIVTKNFDKSKLDLVEMTDNMAADIVSLFPNLKKAVLRRRVYARFSTLNQMAKVDKKNSDKIKEMINFIKKYKWNILADSNVPLRDKFAVLLIQINYNLYKYVWRKFK
ncbi:glycosyltransferase family 2 protein [Candidatus Ruminimicrobiellum ovillum]|uniref:glycosyltransferase family 2 protein n=1 Tax=Candidatus Ruminimicrobiellum ovillum TaxID=1947927 RepID=UPI003559804B